MRYAAKATASVVLSVALAGCATGGTNGGLGLGASADAQKHKVQNEMPHCDRAHGTIAVYAPKKDWWTPLHLPSPEGVLKVVVKKSGCFRLVDRGEGFEMAQRERALAAGGDLRQGSNQGKGQVLTADYVLVPDIVSKNNNASGTALAGIVGAFVPGAAGILISAIKIESKTADVVLTVTDVRSSEQLAMAEGHGEHTDVGFGAGGALAGTTGVGAAAVGAYQNTTIGQVLILAYLDAYSKMIGQLGYELPANASAANAVQAYVMTENGHLFKGPSAKSGTVRTLAVGTMVYPTGVKHGGWWEVKDELGNTGYVAFQVVKIAH